jgi:hypothetical protein
MSARPPWVDWRGWRSDIVRRLDRGAILGAFGLALFSLALMHFEHVKVDAALLAARSLYWLTIATLTLLTLAASMVAVARGARPWVAYALAGVVIVTVAAAADLAFAPYAWKVGTAGRHIPATVIAHLTILSMLLARPPSSMSAPATRRTMPGCCARSTSNGRPRRSAWSSNGCRPSWRRSTTIWS